ncbi:hypothetical protein [Agromyces larvae]|uniref:Uncharacterized protein n=1 Tax=Agromyces larvae TaxID=2929802 RepID=A0ABY4C4C9_9MICO|nr:hypothetical protein [Agromyces larvae]UOE45824.1 hypothetical protein MTO99_08805 [Agromyces larvae]
MNGVLFLIAMAIFVFGLWLFGIAETVPGFQAPVFFAGILCVAIALAIPTTVLGRGGGR